MIDRTMRLRIHTHFLERWGEAEYGISHGLHMKETYIPYHLSFDVRRVCRSVRLRLLYSVHHFQKKEGRRNSSLSGYMKYVRKPECEV